jgi:2-polyprenyl-3-methyl-5-hydroxy-6-metoxy-1,4-benzoquinol methylase
MLQPDADSRLSHDSSPHSDLDYGLHYRIWHDDSNEHASEMARGQAAILLPHLPADKQAACLDVGCGMGFTLLGLRELGFSNVHGIDIDKSQVAACHARGLSAERVESAESYLLARPTTFDVVTMLDVLEHVPVDHQIGCLRAIWSALRPGGRLIVQVPNANAILASRWRYIDFTHFSSFTEHSIAFALGNAGFVDIDVPLPQDPRPSWRLWKREARKHFFPLLRRWVVRQAWRQVYKAELGSGSITAHMPLDVNLMAIAFRRNEPIP